MLQFSMRLLEVEVDDDHDHSCFCLTGHACDTGTSSLVLSEEYDNIQTTTNTGITNNQCAKETIYQTSNISTSAFSRTIYHFLLTPLTRWDSARFLHLAVNPTMRDPPRISIEDCSDLTMDNGQENSCQASHSYEDVLFLQSEQSHAFFPFLPLIFRWIANAWIQHLPLSILPPTYEAVVVLAALFWNTTSFIVASMALYYLTLILVGQQSTFISTLSTSSKKERITEETILSLAFQTFLFFCFNPASVFFTAAYSESTFAMCNFVGHAVLAQGMIPTTRGSAVNPTSKNNDNISFRKLVLYSCFALPFWMAASYTRSNGTMQSCWILLLGISLVCSWWRKMSLWKAILGFLHCSLLALMIVLPVFWHDASGYERHCHISTEDEDHVVRPSWCRDLENADEHFSLYGYVQLVHWNVGIFRYYQWKQIPNFLLAAPILILSFAAVVHWIMASWKRYHSETSTDISYPQKVIRWAIASMEDAVPEMKHERRSNATKANMVSGHFYQELLMGPLMLNHYAVLAAISMIGLLIAHVQISTRLICSSCPAIYWFMALCFLGQETGSRMLSFLGKCIPRYCVLYILLGAIMHTNWLPWT